MTSHRPARVSSALRISTLTSRLSGTRGVPEMSSCIGAGVAMVLMPGLLRWRRAPARARGELVALGVLGEGEEQLLEAAVGGAQVGEDDRAARRRPGPPRPARASTRRPVPAGATSKPLSRSALVSSSLSSAVTNDDLVVGVREQLVLGAAGHDLAAADQDHLVGDLLDLVEQVAGEQHGAAAVGVRLEQAAHPADAGRVEAVGRLVEDQHGRVAEQGVGDAEPLLHAERVVAQPALRLGLVERDQLEHLVDAGLRQAHGLGADGEDLAAGAAGVLGRGVEQHADVPAGVGDVVVEVAADRDPTRAWAG